MVERFSDLDSTFGALADPTRRDILKRVASQELSVGEIAEAYNLTLAAVSKHLQVMERAGLIVKRRQGKRFFVRASATTLGSAAAHLQYYESLLNNRLDSLATYLRKEEQTMLQTKTPAKPVAEETAEQEIVVSHIFDAPRQRVWEAYTEPKQIAQWWGLQGASLVSCESELRPGGIWRFVLRSADGKECPFSGIFQEIVPGTRLVYTDGVGEATEPRPESMVTITFEDLPGGKTKLTKKSVALPSVYQLQAAWLNRMQPA